MCTLPDACAARRESPTDLLVSLKARCAGATSPRADAALELPSSCADKLSSRDALSACLAEPGSLACPASGRACPGLCSAVIRDPLALGSSAYQS